MTRLPSRMKAAGSSPGLAIFCLLFLENSLYHEEGTIVGLLTSEGLVLVTTRYTVRITGHHCRPTGLHVTEILLKRQKGLYQTEKRHRLLECTVCAKIMENMIKIHKDNYKEFCTFLKHIP